MQNAIELKTGIEEKCDWFEVWLCGEKVGEIIGRSRAIAHLFGVAAHRRIDWKAARAAYVAALAAESAPEPPTSAPEAATVAPAAASVSRPRCTFHKAIRRCYAISRDLGLDTRSDEAMRRAFGRALGRTIETREAMNASDWQAVGDMMKRGVLAW